MYQIFSCTCVCNLALNLIDFTDFFFQQLDLIEEGQMYRAPKLIPDIFKFLVLLSYEKYHSKPIIDIPKILQLCEGLFASGQHAETFVMPALIPGNCKLVQK